MITIMILCVIGVVVRFVAKPFPISGTRGRIRSTSGLMTLLMIRSNPRGDKRRLNPRREHLVWSGIVV